jgi:hypothetical protein
MFQRGESSQPDGAEIKVTVCMAVSFVYNFVFHSSYSQLDVMAVNQSVA